MFMRLVSTSVSLVLFTSCLSSQGITTRQSQVSSEYHEARGGVPGKNPKASPSPEPIATSQPAPSPSPSPAPSPSAAAVKINFQLGSAPLPSGYLMDSGAAFADRGNGHAYGWNADASGNARDRNADSDQRYDTLIYMQKNGVFDWELAVDNGTYEVRLVAGDPVWVDGVYEIHVEGQSFISGVASDAQKYFDVTRTVSVADGRLSVSNGSGSSHNRINFIEVTFVSSEIMPTTTTTTSTTTTSAPSTTTTTTMPVSSGSGWQMCPSVARAAGEPELPRVCIDTTMPAFTRVVNVAAGDAADLQNKINAAQPGDDIVLPAGSTYIGNFVLPNKSGTGWIRIRTSNLSGIPAERSRVIPAQHAAAMPKILTPNTQPAIRTAYGAHNYRLTGLEVGIVAGVGSVSKTYHEVVSNLVIFGDAMETSVDQLAKDMVIDRCYIHGNRDGNMRRAVTPTGIRIAIIDSHLSEAHEKGADSQAIGSWGGGGPYKIVNNHLEGAGENVLFGGSDPSITNLVAEDIEVRRNFMTKPLRWKNGDPSYDGIPWVVKNTFELKAARRVLIEGNVIERSWVMGQAGYLVLFTVRNQGGRCTQCQVSDVTFVHNVVRDGAAGFQLLGTDNVNPSLPTQRIKIAHNVIDQIGGGNLFLVAARDLDSVSIDHNTIRHGGNVMMLGNYNSGSPDQATNFSFKNNIFQHNNYGIFGDNVGYGNAAISTYLPGSVFSRNVMVRNISGTPSVSSYPNASLYPTMTGSSFVMTDGWAPVGMVDFSGGDYRLSSSSPFLNFATDGGAVGADIDLVNEKAAEALSGN